jgi:hypothetical protein
MQTSRNKESKKGEILVLASGACFACTIRNPRLFRGEREREREREACGVSGALVRRQSYTSCELLHVPTEIFIVKKRFAE